MALPDDWAKDDHPLTGPAYAPLGQVFNDIGGGQRTWYGAVSANNNDLNSVGTLRVGTIQPASGVTVTAKGTTWAMVATEVTLADDASIALETAFGLAAPLHGVIDILDGNNVGSLYGRVVIRTFNNSVTEVDDPDSAIATTDSDGSVCFLADGDSTYTLKNRRGGTRTFYLFYKGSQ